MDTVELKRGYSIYGENIVSDREISYLIGLDNYQALRSLDEETFAKISNEPFLPEIQRVTKIALSESDLNVEGMKRSLVVRCIDGPLCPEANRIVPLILRRAVKVDHQLVDNSEEMSFLIVATGILLLTAFAIYKIN